MEIGTSEYESLNKDSVVWFCMKCDSGNHTSSFFHSYELETHNSYSILSHLPNSSNISSVTLPSPTAFNPRLHSSPVLQSHATSSPNASTPGNTTRKSSCGSNMAPPKRNNWRALIVNCNSIQGKASSLRVVTNYIDPDVIMGTESKLGNNTGTAEVFPTGYTVHRKDRKHGGGGVFLAIKDCYPSSLVESPGDSEQIWARISLRDSKHMLVGSFYRPPSKTQDPFNDLSDMLENITTQTKDKLITIGGDFNCKDINWDTHKVETGSNIKAACEHLLAITENNGLTQLQREPTRENSVLDLYFTNNASLVKGIHTVPGISDHDMIVVDSVIKPVINRKKPRKINQFSKADWDTAKSDTIKFAQDYATSSPNRTIHQNWKSLKDHIFTTMDSHVPSKMSKSRSDLPWLTTSLKRIIRRKNKLYAKAKKSKNSELLSKYKSMKRHTQKALRNAEWNYINNILIEGLERNDSKPFWKYVKSKKQENIGVAPLRKGSNLNSDSLAKAQILSDQFRSVFTKADNSRPTLEGNPYPPLPKLTIHVDGVEKLLSRLKINKSSGPDDIPNRVLKELSHELAPVLTSLFIQSTSTGELPEDWRNANISPIFKKGDRHIASNYRPVSLTCVCCKLLEHIVCRHIRDHLDTFNIITPLQHGFRRKYSCDTQLLTTMHDLMEMFDRKQQVDVAVLDFSKAFDTVPHDKLLDKLKFYGIHGNTHHWITSFLKLRQQSVVIEGISSDSVHVESGVPQGTVMGPLLFLLYINDLPRNVNSQVRLFADDCLLYRAIRGPDDQLQLQRDLQSLGDWASTWGMSFNPNKCYIMTITAKKSQPVYLYTMIGCVLSKVSDITYLGITITDNLQWETHITGLTAKANRTLGFLRRNLRNCPRQLRQLAYFSLVRSRLEYAATIWDPHLAKDITRVEAVQRRAARFVMNDHKRCSSVSTMLKTLDWNQLDIRRKNGRLTFLKKIISGRVAVNPSDYLTEGVTRTRTVNSQKYKHYSAKTLVFKNSFFPRTIPEWNKTPDQAIVELLEQSDRTTTSESRLD